MRYSIVPKTPLKIPAARKNALHQIGRCGLAVGAGDADELQALFRMTEDDAARVRQGPANGRNLDPMRGQFGWRGYAH